MHARDRSTTARSWQGTPTKNATPCILPENDTRSRGVPTRVHREACRHRQPNGSAQEKRQADSTRERLRMLESAADKHALAAANAPKNSAITHPCRPSAYWLIIFRDGETSGFRICSAASAMSASTAAAMAALAAVVKYVIVAGDFALRRHKAGLLSPHATM